MQIIEDKQVIPQKVIKEHVVVNKKYVADDGTKFDYELDCKNYEKQCQLKESVKNIPYKKIELLDELHGSDAFYITTEEEYNAVLDYLMYADRYTDESKRYKYDTYWFDQYQRKKFKGNDWYCFQIEYDYDSGNKYHIRTRSDYREVIRDFLRQFKR